MLLYMFRRVAVAIPTLLILIKSRSKNLRFIDKGLAVSNA